MRTVILFMFPKIAWDKIENSKSSEITALASLLLDFLLSPLDKQITITHVKMVDFNTSQQYTSGRVRVKQVSNGSLEHYMYTVMYESVLVKMRGNIHYFTSIRSLVVFGNILSTIFVSYPSRRILQYS